jgi:hypothetical protein
MQVETKFLRLSQAVEFGTEKERDGWQVCWLGGWDKHRLFYLVMVMRVKGETQSWVMESPTRVTFSAGSRPEER